MEDDSSLFLYGWGILVCTVLYGLSVMCSIAVAKSRLRRLNGDESEGGFGVKVACRILDQAELYVVAGQLGTFISPLLAGFFFYQALLSVYSTGSETPHLSIPDISGWVLVAGVFLCISFAATILVQLARSIAHSHPELILRIVSYPLRVIGFFGAPFLRLLRFIIQHIFRALGMKTVLEKGLAITADDLSEILDHSAEAGSIEEEEREMIEGVFDLSDTLVREVMTPRADIVSVNRNATRDELIDVFAAHGFSRVLVIGDELDDVLGIVIAKDLLMPLRDTHRRFAVQDYVRPVYSVSGEKSVDEVLREFQREAVQYATVLDEHGGVDGIVTFEDLVEEIVGEVFDEYDVPEEELEFQETLTGDILVDGSTVIDDLNEEYDFSFPEGEYDTIAGFMIHTLGHLPDVGEEVQHDGLTIRVEGLNQNRITQLRILKEAPQ